MLQQQTPNTLYLIDAFTNEDKLIALKALANTAGMRAMSQLVQHYHFDPLRAARDLENAPDLDQRNAVDEAERVDVFGRSVEDLNRITQGFTPNRPRLDIAADWVRVRKYALEQMLPMNPGRYDEPMLQDMLYDYSVRSFALRNIGQAKAAARALGTQVDVEAAEDRIVQAAAVRFAAVRDDCLSTFEGMHNTLEGDDTPFVAAFDPPTWIGVTVKIADTLCKDAIRLEHNTAGFLHLTAGLVATRMDSVDQLMLEADRIIHENQAAVIEAASRNWLMPTLTGLTVNGTPYGCQKRLDSWRKIRAEQLKIAA